MSVHDLAAKREARRRRILENSEKRLTKIISCDKARENVFGSEDSNNIDQLEHRNGIVSSPKSFIQPKPTELLHSLVQDEEDVSDVPILSESIKEHWKTKDIEYSKVDNDKTDKIFWADCLFIGFLSFIVRLMYTFNLSPMFGESLFVPFIAISVAKVAANPTKRTSKSAMCGTIVKASLLLSGVPDSWLNKIFLLTQIIVDLGHDFALYLFSFTISHIFLESFVMR